MRRELLLLALPLRRSGKVSKGPPAAGDPARELAFESGLWRPLLSKLAALLRVKDVLRRLGLDDAAPTAAERRGGGGAAAAGEESCSTPPPPAATVAVSAATLPVAATALPMDAKAVMLLEGGLCNHCNNALRPCCCIGPSLPLLVLASPGLHVPRRSWPR